MNYIFIINPVSGNSKALKASIIIDDYCKSKKLNYKLIYTTKKDDARKIAEQYKNCLNTTIFSVGGDGTLNEIVNGIANSTVNLSVIPAGTGNDFYKSISDFKGKKIDLGKVNDKYFINVASLGFDAEIANYANELKKYDLPNKLIYILSIIHEYFSFNPVNINLNEENIDTTILTVCNAKYYGGGFKIAPKAKLNDGMFDIIDVRSLNKIEILSLILKLINVKHLDSKEVNFFRTDSINVDSLVPLICNIDGEIFSSTKFAFSIEKDAINIDNCSKNYIELCNVLRKKRLIK